jgi:hypothetical protein
MPDGSRLLFTTAGLPNARVLALLRLDVRVPQDFVGDTLRRWIELQSTYTLNYLMFTHLPCGT